MLGADEPLAAELEGHRGAALLRRKLPGGELTLEVDRSQITAVVPVGRLLEVARWLRDDASCLYELPVLMTCVDWPERLERFDVTYLLRSLMHNDLIRIVVRADQETEVPSLSGLFIGMNWHERECYDLFGLKIVGHPDLTRILLPDDWEGHPLRKDYVSFGEPVAFTHNIEWALSAQDRPEYLPGATRGAVEKS